MLWNSEVGIASLIALIGIAITFAVNRRSKNAESIIRMSERYQNTVRPSVRELWHHFREVCNEDTDALVNSYNLTSPLNEDLSIVREFYADLAQLYIDKQISKKDLLRRWASSDLEILSKIVIPIQNKQSTLMNGKLADLSHLEQLLKIGCI